MTTKPIIAFAYAGEFSYGVSWWYPKIRELAKTEFMGCHIIVFDYLGRYGLCKDFVDEFIPYDSQTESQLGWPMCGVTRNKANQSHNSGILDTAALRFVNNYQTDNNLKFVHIITAMNYNKWSKERHNLSSSAPTRSAHQRGDYINLDARSHMHSRVIKELQQNLLPQKQTVAVMARTRKRLECHDLENWNPESWQIFINKLVDELDVNVVLIGTPPRPQDGYPGALDFPNKNNRIYSMVRNNPDAVEEQIAVLKNTKCSFYGASGAAFLTFFTNTPVFILSNKNGCSRLSLEWCKKLTGGHHNVKIYKLASEGKEYYNQDPDVVFDAFKTFYEELK